MQIRLPLWSIPAFSFILILGCTPRQTSAPTDTSTTRNGDKGALMEETRFSNEIYVLVSTDGNTFSVSPDPVIVHHPSQKVIWIAEDPAISLEITFRPDKGRDTGAEPPGKPCDKPARKCGQNSIGGRAGKYHYSVNGTRAGQQEPLDELDPVLEILP